MLRNRVAKAVRHKGKHGKKEKWNFAHEEDQVEAKILGHQAFWEKLKSGAHDWTQGGVQPLTSPRL